MLLSAFNVLSWFIGIVGTVLTYISWKQGQKKLHYTIFSNTIAIRHDKARATGLTVLDKKNQEVRGNVGVLDIEFQNLGPLPVSNQDVDEFLRIFLRDANRILDASITEQTVRGDPGFNVFLLTDDQGACLEEYTKIFSPAHLRESGINQSIENPHAKSVGITWHSFHTRAKVKVAILYETDKLTSSPYEMSIHGPSFSEKNLIRRETRSSLQFYVAAGVFISSAIPIVIVTALDLIDYLLAPSSFNLEFLMGLLFNTTIISTFGVMIYIVWQDIKSRLFSTSDDGWQK